MHADDIAHALAGEGFMVRGIRGGYVMARHKDGRYATAKRLNGSWSVVAYRHTSEYPWAASKSALTDDIDDVRAVVRAVEPEGA